jgi:ribosomal protein S12 methylthiotransferase
MPIQHVSTPVLRAMQRPGNAESLRSLFLELRRRVPGITLRTTVIVGFPGEKEADFQRLCDFVEEVQFDRLGIFTYSREPGTPAYSLSGRPRAQTAQRRLQELTERQLHIAGQRAAARIGERVRVLVDALLEATHREETPLAPGARAVGRTEGEALDIDGLLFLEGPEDLRPGSFVEAEVLAADVHDLRARVRPERPDAGRGA